MKVKKFTFPSYFTIFSCGIFRGHWGTTKGQHFCMVFFYLETTHQNAPFNTTGVFILFT